MPILNRRQDESIVFDTGESEITIKLIVTEGNQAKIGISAPDEVKILREELLQDSD